MDIYVTVPTNLATDKRLNDNLWIKKARAEIAKGNGDYVRWHFEY